MYGSSNSEAQPDDKESTSGCNPFQCRCGHHWFPQRIVLAILLHICLQSNFNTRVVVNVAIVEMAPSPKKHMNYTVACPELGTPEDNQQEGSLQWPQHAKSLVLNGFYIGYTLTQVPGGWLADTFGARPVIITCVGITVLSTALFPVFTEQFGYIAAVILRVILGAAHGPCMPAICSLISIWFPPDERATWGGISFAGPILGTIIGTAATGFLIHSFNGWPAPFYFWSAYSGLYFVFILIFLYSFPNSHPFISREEAEYIGEHTVGTRTISKRSFSPPWKEILTNMPYWANVAAQFGHNYIFYSLITYLPSYLSDILQFDVRTNGIIAAIPFLFLWITTLILSATTRHFIDYFSQHRFDKYFGAGCNVVSAALLIAAAYSGCHRYMGVSFYVISMIVKAFYYVTLPTNINALSRNYAGFMFGICNAIGSLSGIISNSIIGNITKERRLWEWQLAFWITLGIELVTTVFYFVFSSAERQDFDYAEGELHDMW